MKKYLIFLFLSGMCLAQTNGRWIVQNEVRTFSDSLQYTATDTLNVKDSVWVVSFSFNPSYVRVLVKGNTNSPVDSIDARLGYDTYTNDGSTLVSTYYSDPIQFKDSSNTIINTLIGSTTNKSYWIFLPGGFHKIKFSLLNHIGTLRERGVTLIVEAIKE